MANKSETQYLMEVALDQAKFQAELITAMNTQNAATVSIIEALVPIMRSSGCSQEDVLAVTTPVKASMASLGGVIERFQELTTKLGEVNAVFVEESGGKDV